MADRFILGRRDGWARLEALLVSPRGTDAAARFEELGWRYREASADLAVARRDYPTDPATRYLNDLVERAYRRLYGRRHRGLAAIWAFYRAEFPVLFRQT